jgi:hypothetical protein
MCNKSDGDGKTAKRHVGTSKMKDVELSQVWNMHFEARDWLRSRAFCTNLMWNVFEILGIRRNTGLRKQCRQFPPKSSYPDAETGSSEESE